MSLNKKLTPSQILKAKNALPSRTLRFKSLVSRLKVCNANQKDLILARMEKLASFPGMGWAETQLFGIKWEMGI